VIPPRNESKGPPAQRLTVDLSDGEGVRGGAAAEDAAAHACKSESRAVLTVGSGRSAVGATVVGATVASDSVASTSASCPPIRFSIPGSPEMVPNSESPLSTAKFSLGARLFFFPFFELFTFWRPTSSELSSDVYLANSHCSSAGLMASPSDLAAAPIFGYSVICVSSIGKTATDVLDVHRIHALRLP
jgi:hypothetical protein